MVQTKLTANSLRIVGKAWQVRALLRQYTGSHLTLQQFLEQHVHPTSTTR